MGVKIQIYRPYYAASLAFCNLRLTEREAHGPLMAWLPAGKASATGCPCAVGSGLIVSPISWRYDLESGVSDPHSLPDGVEAFIFSFDTLYSSLEPWERKLPVEVVPGDSPKILRD
jgi:hypothetical protein